MNKIYFTGCSITAGQGFEFERNDLQIYPNLVCAEYQVTCINQAEGGSDNHKIFIKTAKAIMDHQADVYVVQWSALHRHWLYPAPNKGIYLGSHIEESPLKSFITQYQLLNHDYNNIMTVIDYTRILENLAQSNFRRVVFVNGMIPWTEDLLTQKDYGLYAQELFKDLDNNEVDDFKNRLANNLELVNWSLWANPWSSIMAMQQDNAPLDNHPGAKTHEQVARKVITVLDQLDEQQYD
jgi:hypothetical protein